LKNIDYHLSAKTVTAR